MQKTTKIIVTHVIVGVILILTFIAVKMIGSSKKSASGIPGMPPANSMAGGGAGGGTAKPGSSTSKEAAAGNGTSGAGAGNANGGTGMDTNGAGGGAGAGKNGMAAAGNTMPGNANSNTSGKKSQTVTPVRTVVANEVILQDYVMTSGDIQTQTSIEVFPSIGGTVVQMNVSLGSPVKKGDVIGYIDPSEPGSYYAKSPITCPISGSILTAPVKPGQKVQASSVIQKLVISKIFRFLQKFQNVMLLNLQLDKKPKSNWKPTLMSAFLLQL